MSAINCCSFPRSSSPGLPNSRVVETPQHIDNQPLQQFDPLPLFTPASTMGSAQSREVREIFTSAQDDDPPRASISLRRRKRPKRQPPATVRHKESNGRLYTFAERLKRKMSLESGLSRRSSGMRLKHSIDEEDIERRQELKRALHRRLQEDLLRDRSASQGGYDEDAIPIPMPQMTLPRNQDLNQINPKEAADEYRQLHATQTSERKLSGQSKPEKYSPKVTTIQDGSTVRRVLRKKSSVLAALDAEQHPPGIPTEPDIRLASGQSTSPFQFNNLVVPKRSQLTLRKASVEQIDTADRNCDATRPRVLVKGASGVLGRSTPNIRLQFGYSREPSRQVPHRAYDPTTEDLGFSGIDGAADNQGAVRVSTEQRLIPHWEAQAGQHAATGKIRVSQSLSQIAESSDQWHKRSSSSVYSKQPNVYRSSSQHSAQSSVVREAVLHAKQHPDRSTENLCLRKPHQHVASSIYSSFGGSQQDIANLDGIREPCPASRRKSTAYDLFSAENKATSSRWEKAFQAHTEEDNAIAGKKRNSILPRRKCSVAIRRRDTVSQNTDSVTLKRGSPESTRHGLGRPALRRLETYSFASSLRSVSPSGGVRDPTASRNATNRGGRNASPARSSGSWTKFPSHTRPERSLSPANSSDGVFSRDFAMEITQTRNPSDKPLRTLPTMDKRKSRSLTFRKSLTNTLGRLYRSQELRGHNDKGHRSSISAGGLTEYPELELPAGLGEGAASAWSKIYEDCVPQRDVIDASSVVDLGSTSPKWQQSISRENIGRVRKTSSG